LTSAASCNDMMFEWVGVGGLTDSDLIQAGIGESPSDPYTGTCATGTFYIWAWWEVLPAYSTPISTMEVTAGDTVTVTLSRVDHTTWDISLLDHTNGQSFSTQQAYDGRGGSADWIVEAPTDQSLCGANADDICTLAPYSPATAFSGVASSGAATELSDLDMDQGNGVVSEPSTVAGWPSSFTVGYVGTGGGSVEAGPAVGTAKWATGKSMPHIYG
jgi:Peptidase A4 family